MYEVVKPQTNITPRIVQDFIAYVDASTKTVQTYERALRQFVMYLSLNGIKTPQRADIIAYRDYLLETHKATTVASYMVAVRLLFQWCAEQGIYPNIAERIKVKTDKGHKKDSLTSTQAKELLKAVNTNTVKGKRDYAMLSLIITTGLRACEVSQADIQDLKTVGNTTCLFIKGKGRQDKTDFVKVPPQTETIIRQYLKVRQAKDIAEPLFTSTSNRSLGNRISTRTVSKIAKDSFKAIGIDSERITCHSLRHTAVTLSLLNGNSLQETKEFARHSNINTTLVYAHNLDRLDNGCSQSIADDIL